ncbi:hypothetical protein IID20_02165, partial [Patescibacteria group bacterium]|nr:hypothetical protein [Patescibacteria group bacterium]
MNYIIISNKKVILSIFLLIIGLISILFLVFSNVSRSGPKIKLGQVDGLLIKLKNNPKIYKVESLNDFDLEEWQEIILQIPNVEWAELSYLFKISYV